MKRLKSRRHLQRFVSIHDPIANLFHMPRHDIPSSHHRELRAAAMSMWAAIAYVRPMKYGLPTLHRRSQVNFTVPIGQEKLAASAAKLCGSHQPRGSISARRLFMTTLQNIPSEGAAATADAARGIETAISSATATFRPIGASRLVYTGQ